MAVKSDAASIYYPYPGYYVCARKKVVVDGIQPERMRKEGPLRIINLKSEARAEVVWKIKFSRT
ncbi:MAG: hypothetical protein WBI18_03120 [Candidatus Saccharicenans sp.]